MQSVYENQWEYLVKADEEFWTPCEIHSFPKKFYDLEMQQVYCEECSPSNRCVKIYRNMLKNVVRVTREQCQYSGIQVFTSNKHPVIYLKPFKGKADVNLVEKVCRCGCGVAEASTFCSVKCFLERTPDDKVQDTRYKVQPYKPKCRARKYISKPRKNQRKSCLVIRSPVY